MNISLIQTDIVWADKTANLAKTERLLRNMTGTTDLVVLPEMFTTGFCTDRLELAETMEGETIQKLREWAKEFQLAISGSFIAKESDRIFNRAFFVFPSGEIHTADKRHLFSYGGEQRYFSSGNERLLVHYKGFNICVLVCYDVRFPVWSRNKNNEYDLLVYTASFSHTRMYAWDTLLKARAIENQAYVCGVNRVGEDGKGLKYSGHSVLLDFLGKEIESLPEYENGIITQSLSIDELAAFRKKYAFWQDADRFDISF